MNQIPLFEKKKNVSIMISNAEPSGIESFYF